MIEKAEIIKVYSVKKWMEKDFFGTIHIFRQHEGQEPVDLVQIQYDHRHNDNASQHAMAVYILNNMIHGEHINHTQGVK